MTHQHLDAEVVAAWADGSLDPHARAAAEAHTADCVRCQAVLAAMIRTEPVTVQPERGWIAGRVRWLVPLATAAAAALWVGLSMDVLAPGTPPQVASRTEPAPAAAADRAATMPAPIAATQATEAPKREVEDARPRQRVATLPSGPPAAKEAPPVTEKPAAVAETVVVDNVRRDAAAGRQPAAPPAATPVTSTPPLPPPATVATQAEPARKEFRTLTESLEVGQQSAMSLREVASPDLTSRWRIGRGGTIYRSTDAGKTWVAQKSGVTLDLFAASAPSPDVCWIVGRSGVVLLTTNGETWRRVPFAEPADLRAVAATDARTATVTTLDGRAFRTFDGGMTWQR